MKFNLLSIATTFFGVLASNILLASGASAITLYTGGNTGTADIKYYSFPDVGSLGGAPGGTYIYKYNCPSGFVINGGLIPPFNISSQIDGITLIASYPSSDKQWTIRYKNTTNVVKTVRMYLICIN
ncbi:MAG: hypothetical protein RMX96_23285 [Nostoc sp. ChiSLP02]|nr:hypothetical protein [Nostoc sp. DedSLP05]MDZ8103313.1 hypothetical protein [Nostoc sp. DedSLP01]MDZ8187761.1 hypothetical protein [Nostoc sp. ChiSLP02]